MKTQKQHLNAQLLAEIIEPKIWKIRGSRVMLDSDLADLYEVKTKELNKAVKRNIERFPKEFMFKLSLEEVDSLRFQTGTSKKNGRGGRRYLPNAFTEQGIAMLSSVLNSYKAIQVNIVIMKTFIRLREIIGENQSIVKRLDQVEKQLVGQDLKIDQIFKVIRDVLQPEVKPKRRIGFRPTN